MKQKIQTHPALETLIIHVNNSPFTKENLIKWVTPLPSRERLFLINKINEDISKADMLQVLADIKAGNIDIPKLQVLPSVKGPSLYKKGDVLMHPAFKHPYILLEKKRNYWLCCLITSEAECKEILEPCESRFFYDGFITKVLFTSVEPIGNFMFPFENSKQLNSITKKLKDIFA